MGAQNPAQWSSLFGEDLSNEHRLRQLQLKWLIKTYATTTNKANFLFTKPEHEKLNNKLERKVSEAAY
jgi:hypothetical protein